MNDPYFSLFFCIIFFMRVGYVRVFTVEQSEERQIVELKENANVEKFFEEGKRHWCNVCIWFRLEISKI